MVRTLLISVFGIAAGLAIAFALSRPNGANESPAGEEKPAAGVKPPRTTEPCVNCDFPTP